MKLSFFICFIFMGFYSFGQNNLNEKAIIQSENYEDSIPIGNYIVSVSKCYVYKLPNLLSKTKNYLLKYKFFTAYKKANGFMYGAYSTSSGENNFGWLSFKQLKEIRFTPPKISN